MSDLIKILNEKNIDLKRLSRHSGVPLAFLEKLSDGDFESFPSYPYVRSYLRRLTNALGLGEETIEKELGKLNLKISGQKDKLPVNRFKLKHSYKKKYLAIFFFLTVVIVSFYLLKSFIGPSIYFNNPNFNSKNLIFTANPCLTLSGKISQNCLLYLNGQEILVGAKGEFKKEILLGPGLNTLDIGIKSLFGRQKNIIKQIFLK